MSLPMHTIGGQIIRKILAVSLIPLFFMFASHEYANMTGEFKKTRGLVYKELRKIRETSIWTVKIGKPLL